MTQPLLPRYAFAFALAVTLAGCVTVPTNPASAPHVGEIGASAQRSVGDTIYERYNYTQLSGARLAAPFQLGAKILDILAVQRGHTFQLGLLRGEVLH